MEELAIRAQRAQAAIDAISGAASPARRLAERSAQVRCPAAEES